MKKPTAAERFKHLSLGGGGLSLGGAQKQHKMVLEKRYSFGYAVSPFGMSFGR